MRRRAGTWRGLVWFDLFSSAFTRRLSRDRRSNVKRLHLSRVAPLIPILQTMAVMSSLGDIDLLYGRSKLSFRPPSEAKVKVSPVCVIAVEEESAESIM